MKFLGITLVFLVSAMIGLYLSDRLKKRTKELETCLIFIDKLKTSLRYRVMSTNDLIRSSAETETLSCLSCIATASDLLKSGMSFPLAWKKAVESFSKDSTMIKEDLEILASLAEIVGTRDLEGQINALEMIESQFRHQLDQARLAHEKKGKLFRSLGALTGIGLAIVLI